jgi:hypothetical protein
MALATNSNSSRNKRDSNNNNNLFELIAAPHDLRIHDLNNTENGADVMYCSLLTI